MTGGTDDVVLVTVDSLRADHCGFLGSEYSLTPALDAIAADGLVFENAVAPGPRTPSSVPATFTGIDLPAPEGEDWDFEDRRGRIAEHVRRYRTIADRLGAEGYHTVGFTTNPWTQGTSFDASFDEFHELSASTAPEDGEAGSLLFRTLERTMSVDALADRFRWDVRREWFATWPQYFETIREAVHSTPEPAFVWIFLLDAHQPYVAPPRYREENSALGLWYAMVRGGFLADADASLPPHLQERIERAYRDATRSVDAFVDRLRESVLDDGATVVFHSDHGEAFGEHGTYGHQPALYDENLHVPLLVDADGVDGRVESPVSLCRLPELLRALAAPDVPFDPDLFTTPVTHSATEDGRRHALRSTDWKYCYDRASGRAELYDLRVDPAETENLLGGGSTPGAEGSAAGSEGSAAGSEGSAAGSEGSTTGTGEPVEVLQALLARSEAHAAEQRAITDSVGELSRS